jgi:hypothetical protein
MMAKELGTAVATSGLNLSQGNRRSPIPGLPDWSKACYGEGKYLPSDSDIGYRITADELGIKLFAGRQYVLRVRLYHSRAEKVAVMMC